MEVTTENSRKRAAAESSKTKNDRDWVAVAIDTGISVTTILASSFLSGLAVQAGASAYRKMTSSNDVTAAPETSTVLQMQRKSV